jgi:hypothetical protein
MQLDPVIWKKFAQVLCNSNCYFLLKYYRIGASPDCPADTFEQVGTICRYANGSCDMSETCDGTSADCPVDTFEPSGIICRNATGICDLEETCSGKIMNYSSFSNLKTNFNK